MLPDRFAKGADAIFSLHELWRKTCLQDAVKRTVDQGVNVVGIA